MRELNLIEKDELIQRDFIHLVDTPLSESRFADMLEGWVDEEREVHDDHDDHKLHGSDSHEHEDDDDDDDDTEENHDNDNEPDEEENENDSHEVDNEKDVVCKLIN